MMTSCPGDIHDFDQVGIYLADIRPLMTEDSDRADQLLTQRTVVRALLRYVLGTEEDALAHHPDGSPYLPLHPTLSLSVSHCPTAVAIALAPQEIRIGIDIESKGDKAALLLSRYASEEEIRRMNADGTSAVEVWSAKETVYKLAEGAIAGFGEKIVYQGREGDRLLILSKPQDLPDHLHHVRAVPLADLGLLTYALSPDSPDDIPLTWVDLSTLGSL